MKLVKSVLQHISRKAADALKYVGAVVLGIVGNFLIMPPMVMLTAWILQHFYAIPFGMDIAARRLTELPLGRMALAFTLVGFAEEGLFRYFLYDKLLTRFLGLPKIVSLVISSAVFGAVHLGNPGGIPWTIPQATGAAFAGIYFGALYERRGLTYAALVHGGYDFAVTLIALAIRGF